MASFKNVRIQWGVSGSSCSALGTFFPQSRDHTKKSDKEEVRNGEGCIEQVTYYNKTEEATFVYVPKGSGTGGNLPVSLPEVGTTVTVADANGYDAITGSNWIIDELSTQGSNTGAMRETAKLVRYELI